MFNRVMLNNACILIEASGRVPYYPCETTVLGGLQQVRQNFYIILNFKYKI